MDLTNSDLNSELGHFDRWQANYFTLDKKPDGLVTIGKVSIQLANNAHSVAPLE